MYHRGAFKAAQYAYEQALSLREGDFKALFNLSSAYLAKGNVTKAVKYFELARKADVYGQEKRAEEVIIERMKIINIIIQTGGRALRDLSTAHIPVMA